MKIKMLILGLLVATVCLGRGEDLKQITIPYKEYNGHNVTITYDQTTNKVILGLQHNYFPFDKIKEETFLIIKKEVTQLTSITENTTLGNSGYSFHFNGGHIMWSPFCINKKSGVCYYVVFAYAYLNDKVIEAYGKSELK